MSLVQERVQIEPPWRHPLRKNGSKFSLRQIQTSLSAQPGAGLSPVRVDSSRELASMQRVRGHLDKWSLRRYVGLHVRSDVFKRRIVLVPDL